MEPESEFPGLAADRGRPRLFEEAPHRLNTRFRDDTWERITEYAREHSVSKAAAVRMICREFFGLPPAREQKLRKK